MYGLNQYARSEKKTLIYAMQNILQSSSVKTS